jgi:hypothetical protein
MTSVEDLARTIRDAANAGLRVAQGTVVAVVDTTHVSVDLGDRVITAYRPGSVPAGAGAGVRVLVGSGVAEVVSSTGGGWVTPALGASWVYFGGGMAQPGYRLVGDVVQVRGVIKSGSTGTGSPIFTLPVDLRPTGGTETFVVSAGPGAARVEVFWTGGVYVLGYLGGGTNAQLDLSGVRFSTS